MSTIVKRALGAVVVLGVVAGGFAATNKNGTAAKKDEVTYESAKVARGDIKSFVTATGVIQPWKTVDIKSNVDGRIDRLYVDIGDRVKEGQVLMDIDPTNPQTAFDQAQADVEAANARQEQAVVTVQQQKLQANARVVAAQKAILSAKARLAQAKANMDAQPLLVDAGIKQAQASLLSAQKAVAQATRQKETLDQQLETLKKVTIPLNIATVQTNREQAATNLLTAEREFNRQRDLQGMGYVARSDMEAAYARVATMRASVKQAEQRVRTLQQENDLSIKELEARIEQAKSGIEENQARVDQAKASLDVAKTNAVQNDVRAQEYEAAKAGVEQSQADLESAKADLKQILVREKDVIAARAQIVSSRARLNQAKVNLGYTRIVAPRSGVVIVKNVEQGTVVPSSRASIGSTNALLQIGDTSKLWIVCSVDETDIGQVSVGQKVDVKVEAYPSLLVEGKVIRIDPQAKLEQNVTNIPVTVEITEADDKFKPLMNATCEFIVDSAEGVLTVPNEAVKETDGTYKVQKVDGKIVDGKLEGKLTDVEVEVGLAGLDATEIRSGLKEDDEVVTKVVQPEKAGTNNPFNPFGGMGGRSNRTGSGGSSGGRGGTSGGSGGSGSRGGGR